MTRDTVNVLSIPWVGNTARKLVGNILNVLMSHLGFPRYIVHVLTVYLQCPGSGNWGLPPVIGFEAKSSNAWLVAQLPVMATGKLPAPGRSYQDAQPCFGPPLWGEELTWDQISNGIQLQTIYLSFGCMMAIGYCMKTTNTWGIDSFNVCYFPKNLTNMVCYYLLAILKGLLQDSCMGRRRSACNTTCSYMSSTGRGQHQQGFLPPYSS